MRGIEFATGKREFHEMGSAVLMEKTVISCRPADSGRHIASELTRFNIGSLPVVDEKEKLMGLVGEFDLLKVLMDGRELETVTAEEIMVRDLKTVQEDTPVDEVIRLMDTHHLIRLPVLKDGRLKGIIARRDILFGYIKATAEYWP